MTSMDNQTWDKYNIGYFLSVTSLMPPCITEIGGKRYMVFNGPEGGWFKIDETVTLEMAYSRWIPWKSSKKEIKPKEDFKEYEIPGSKGTPYTVTFRNGSWSCGCVGFGFRRKCKHVEKAKELSTKNT